MKCSIDYLKSLRVLRILFILFSPMQVLKNRLWLFASEQIPDLHLVGAGAGTQCLPLYRYNHEGRASRQHYRLGVNNSRNSIKIRKLLKPISSIMSMPCCTTPLTAPNMNRTSNVSSHASPSTTTSGSGQPGVKSFWWTCIWTTSRSRPIRWTRIDLDPQETRKALVPR